MLKTVRGIAQPRLPEIEKTPASTAADYARRYNEEWNIEQQRKRTYDIRKLLNKLTPEEQLAEAERNEHTHDAIARLIEENAQEQTKAKQESKKTWREKLEQAKRQLKAAKEKARKQVQKSLENYIESVHKDPVLAFEKTARMRREKKEAQDRLKARVAALLAAGALGSAGLYASEYLRPKKSATSLTPIPTSAQAQTPVVIHPLSPVVEKAD